MCLFLCFVLVHCFKQSANTVEHLHNILKFFICELTHHNFILFIHRPHSFHKLIINFSPKFYGGSNLSFKIHDINMKRCLSHFKKTLTKKKLPQAKCSQQFISYWNYFKWVSFKNDANFSFRYAWWLSFWNRLSDL